MSSIGGGRFVFAQTEAGTGVITLGLNNGTTVPTNAVAGTLNIEVFTATGLSTLPALDTGFTQGMLDPGANITSDNFLTGTNLTLFGGDYAVGDSVTGSLLQGPATITLGTGAQSVIGAGFDTLVGGSGAQLFDGTKGSESITGGTGSYTVYGGSGDTVRGSSSAADTTKGLIVGTAGGQTITLGPRGTYIVSSGTGDKITASVGPANAVISGAKGDTINMTGNTGSLVLIGATGGDAITAGSGSTLMVGVAGDTLTGGAGGTGQVFAAGSTIIIGAGGAETVASFGGNTFSALAGSASVAIAAGGSDIINLSGNTGAEGIIGASGANITLGGGAAGVIGGSATGMKITLGTAANVITDSSVSGAGNTIGGSGAGTLDYISGAASASIVGGALISLAGATGSDTINAFSNASGTEFASVKDTIVAGNGSDSVWGGADDRIGVGNGSVVGGSHTWFHSTSVAGAAVQFGTNDAVTTKGATGFSTATVTVTNFKTGTDSLFYQSETSATNASIVASATTVTLFGTSSSQITLPDGTVMNLIGVSTATLATLNTAGTLFKA